MCDQPDSKALVVINRVADTGRIYFSELRTDWDDSAKMFLSWKYDNATFVEDEVGDVYEVTFKRVARGHGH